MPNHICHYHWCGNIHGIKMFDSDSCYWQECQEKYGQSKINVYNLLNINSPTCKNLGVKSITVCNLIHTSIPHLIKIITLSNIYFTSYLLIPLAPWSPIVSNNMIMVKFLRKIAPPMSFVCQKSDWGYSAGYKAKLKQIFAISVILSIIS